MKIEDIEKRVNSLYFYTKDGSLWNVGEMSEIVLEYFVGHEKEEEIKFLLESLLSIKTEIIPDLIKIAKEGGVKNSSTCTDCTDKVILRGTIESQSKKIDKLRAHLDQNQVILGERNQEIEGINEKYDALQEILTAKNDRIEELELGVGEVNSKHVVTLSCAERMSKEIEGLKKKLKATKNSRRTYEMTAKEYSGIIDERDFKIEELNSEIEGLRKVEEDVKRGEYVQRILEHSRFLEKNCDDLNSNLRKAHGFIGELLGL